MFKLFLAAFAALFIAAVGPTFAADPVAVAVAPLVIPWGSMLHAVLPAAGLLIFGVITWGVAKIAPPFAAVLRTSQTEQLLQMAIRFALNSTAGAVKGETLTVPVANDALRTALQYALDHGGSWVAQFAGDPYAIAQKLYARLDMPEDATMPDFHEIVSSVTDQRAALG